MHASVGMLSRETCPQFGQVNKDVVIIEASGLQGSFSAVLG
jgi:hypothetical protein